MLEILKFAIDYDLSFIVELLSAHIASLFRGRPD